MKARFFPIVLLVFVSCTSGAQVRKVSLNHIALMVNDLKVSTEFYQQTIGLDTIPEPFHDGKHTWFSIGPKSHLHLISGGVTPKDHVKGSHLCFTVASVDNFITVLKAKKIPYEDFAGKPSGVTLRVDGVKQIYFQDPNGYWLEINDARD